MKMTEAVTLACSVVIFCFHWDHNFLQSKVGGQTKSHYVGFRNSTYITLA